MKFKKIFAAMLASSLFLTACGSSDEVAPATLQTSNEDLSYLNGLEDGQIYVRHKNNTFDPIYFGNATFGQGEVRALASNDRIYWFLDDDDKIPTLYKGDSLVMFTNKVLENNVMLERFMDLGYSIGICQMEPTDSGRYIISTDIEKKNTYPYSDADEITKLQNEEVIVESITVKPIRYFDTKGRDGEELEVPEGIIIPTQYGTISGLHQDDYYDVAIYEGTVEHLYKLKANVHILGSMEVIKDVGYSFVDEFLLEFNLPQTLKTGYYSVSGMGIFRYVDDATYDKNTNFNEPNNFEDNESSVREDVEIVTTDNTDIDLTRNNVTEGTNEERAEIVDKANSLLDGVDREEAMSEKTEQITFNINGEGNFEVKVLLTGKENAKANVQAIITTPEGRSVMLQSDKNGDLYVQLYADVAGKYFVTLYNMHDVKAKVTAKPLDE